MARARRAATLAVLALALCGATAAAPARTQPSGQVRLRPERDLPSGLLYWFVSASRGATEPRPLPPSAPDGAVRVPLPVGYSRDDTLLKLLDPVRGLVARVDLASASSAGLLGPNLLRNPDISPDASEWVLEQGEGGAGSVETILLQGPALGGANRALRVNVTALGPEPWRVQLYQDGLSLLEGVPYTVSFWARADRPRPIAVHANVDVGDGHGIGLAADGVPLTPEWRRLTFAFTAAQPARDHCRIVFILGQATGQVDLTGFSLRPGKPGKPVGPNLLVSGDFADGLAPWKLTEADASAKATAQLVDAAGAGPARASGKVARIDVASVGKLDWHVNLAQGGLDLRDGGIYTLAFWAKADRARPISIDAAIDVPDWHHIGLGSRLTLTTRWQRYVVTFTPTQTQRDHNRVAFLLGDVTGVVALAGVSLRRESGGTAWTPGEEPEITLGAEDLAYAQTVTLPVSYRGRGAYGVSVSVAGEDGYRGQQALQASDRGVARLSEVPIGEKLTVKVTQGDQSAEFARELVPGARALRAVALPESWSEVRTLDSAAGGRPPHPLVGVWESERGSKRYRFTFNADGTGSIRPAVVSSAPNGAPTRPVANPFRWYIRDDGRTVVIGTTAYRWEIRGGWRSELVLAGPSGRRYELVRR